MLQSRLMRYLDEVARCGSIRQAAENLNVASSAVNRQILAYERELGAPIFERLPRGLRLTSVGEAVIAYIRDAKGGHRRMVALIDDMKGLRSGEVKVVASAGLVGALLPRLVAQFHKRHARARIHVNVLPVDEIVETVGSGDADLGLAFDLPQDSRLRVLASANCRMGAIVRPKHPLAKRKSVRLGDCAGHALALPAKSLTLRWLLDVAMASASIEPASICESNSVEFLKQSVLRENCVTFLSEADIEDERRAGALVHVPLADPVLKLQTLKLVQRARGLLDPMPNLFAEEIRLAISNF